MSLTGTKLAPKSVLPTTKPATVAPAVTPPVGIPSILSTPAPTPAQPSTSLNVFDKLGTAYRNIATLPEAERADAIKAVQEKEIAIPTRNAFATIFPWKDFLKYDSTTGKVGAGTPAGYVAPVAGQVGPGGAKFGAGLGATNDNAFDINAPGAGLWAAGIDQNDPQQVMQLYSRFASEGKFNLPEFAKFAPTPGTQLGEKELNEFLQAGSSYFADEARKMDKSNKFGDSLIGKIVLGGLTAGAGAIGGPLLGGLVGAGAGGATDGLSGALLGGLGGTVGGAISQAGGLSNFIQNPVSGFTNVFGQQGAVGTTNFITGAAKDAALGSIGGSGGANYSSAAANAVPGLSTGVNPASLAASLGPQNVASAASQGLLAGAGGLSTAAGAGLGATALQALGGAGSGVANNAAAFQAANPTGSAGTNLPQVGGGGATVGANGVVGPGVSTGGGGYVVGDEAALAALGGAGAGTGGLLGVGGVGGATGLGTAGIGALTPSLSSLGGAGALTAALAGGAAGLGGTGATAGLTAALGSLPASLGGAAASTGGSLVNSILSALGGTGGTGGLAGLGSAGLSLLQGVLGQLNSGDLEKLAGKLNATNANLTGYIPPISYRDSILSNLNTIMNNPNTIMQQKPYSDYMDYVQRATERKMVAQGYGGVGQSTNTADAVTRATLESMSGILQRDREIATNQLLPFFNVGINANTNANSGTAIQLQQAANAQNAGNWQNIITGGAGILQNIFG